MSWKCKHCMNHSTAIVQNKVMVFCSKKNQFPSPLFIKAWGCDDYEDSQLHLFKEEKYGK